MREIKSKQVVGVKAMSYVDAHAYDDVGVDAFLFAYRVEEPQANYDLGRPKIENPILF